MLETLLPRISDDETAAALAEAVTSVLDRWGIRPSEKLRLLGAPDYVRLDAYPLRQDPAMLERIGQLLAIDRALQRQDPTASELASWWIRTPHSSLLGASPLAVMLAQGTAGMKQVRAIVEAGPEPDS